MYNSVSSKLYKIAPNNDILKQELCKRILEDLDKSDLQCPYCENLRIHKNDKTPKGLQRYQCACKGTFILRDNTLIFYSRKSCEQWKTMNVVHQIMIS